MRAITRCFFNALADPQEASEGPDPILEAASLDATTGSFTERVHTPTLEEAQQPDENETSEEEPTGE